MRTQYYFDKDRRQNAVMRVIQNSLSSEGINVTEKEILSKPHSLRVYYSTQRNKRKYSLKSGPAADDVYKSKWPYYHLLSLLIDNLQPRKTFSNLTFVAENEFVPSPASSVSSETNSKRPKPTRKVSNDHVSEKVQSKKYATGNQGIFKTRNPSTGFKGRIWYAATIFIIATASKCVQSIWKSE